MLNFGAFMFVGLVMPWESLTSPEKIAVNELSAGRLVGLGFMVLFLRRIPAIMLSYRFMPDICRNWKEALFMGYFGPIGKTLYLASRLSANTVRNWRNSVRRIRETPLSGSRKE
jgi:NhaP-type Na+/H+ or K+/H+ antiporter